MGFILLIFTPDRQSTEALHWCLHKAKETGRLIKVAYVLEEGCCRETAKKKLEEIERQCRTFQVPFETLICEGDYGKACQDLAGKNDIDILVVTEKKKPFFSKWFGGSEARRIASLVPCEIKVYQQ